jgi:septal ring factor EnvC (AmiA/AmiB activator)
VQTYAQQLAAQESEIARLRDQRAELDKKRAALESEVASLIDSMSF